MRRTFSSTMRGALYDQETGEAALALLRFSHDDLNEDLRLCTGSVQKLSDNPRIDGVIANGLEYPFAAVGVVLPEDVADSDPKATLTLDNVESDLIAIIRSIEEGATVAMDIVLADDPDTVEIAFPRLKMTGSDYDWAHIAVDLTIDALTTEPWPGDSITPASFAGLF